MFKIIKKDSTTLAGGRASRARLGLMNTEHGQVRTPAFLPIGTKAAVKAVTAQELKFWGAEIILANTYHLWMRPGDALIKKSGGLHKFMGWDGPILTDSGGFQVFSLSSPLSFPRKRESSPRSESRASLDPLSAAGMTEKTGHGRVLEVSEKGVTFRSDIDGQTHTLTPETSIQIQSNLGSDIALVLDFFPGYPFTSEKVKKSVDLTLLWAERAVRQFEKLDNKNQALFGIVQGGDFPDLRKKCAQALAKFDFPGYAIGGVAVGEPGEVMYRAVEASVPHLEEEKPRHLLGVGTPEQIVQAVARGCDMFDCVLPTRNARHGELFVNVKKGAVIASKNVVAPFMGPDESGNYKSRDDSAFEGYTPPQGSGAGYTTMKITNEQYKEDFTPPDNTCSCYLCTHHTRAYLRHLFLSGEPLAIRLATMHNLRFYLDLMAKIRRAIEFESFGDLVEDYREQ